MAPALFGRDRELGLIGSFLERVEQQGAALLLIGEPGVGKTVLLAAAAEAASAAGLQVLAAAGVEFEADMSFAGLNQVLLPLASRFANLGDPHRDALNVALGLSEGPPPDRLVVANAALAVLRREATDRPLLVIVDDVPWVDRASAGVFGFVARRLAGSHVGLLAASRSGVESFFERAGLPEHEVGPLDDAAASGLMRAHYPALAPRVHQRLLAEAAGNPLALLELPGALSDHQRVALRALPVVLPLSRRLQALYVSRVTALPGRTRQLLLLAALDGTGDLRALRAAGPGRDGLENLEPAEQARLVSVDATTHRLAFRHPLIRSAVVDVATSDNRRWAHAALAQWVGQPERRAWHLAEATVEPDEEVAVLLEEAGHRILRRGDAVGSVAALTRASELSPHGPDRARRLAEAAYIGADVTGDLRNVSHLLADARRADPDLSGSLPAAVAASYALLNGDGDTVTAHRLLVGALQTWGGRYSTADTILVEALQTLLYVCLWALRPELWTAFDAALERTADIPGLLHLEIQTIADPVRTATPAVLEQLDAAILALDEETDVARIDRTLRSATYVDRLSDCRSTLWGLIRSGREGSAVTAGIFALMLVCIDDYFTGRWDETGQLGDEGLALCQAHGYGLLAWPFRLGLALVAAARGEHDRTRALTEEMMQWAAPRRVRSVQLYCHHARELEALGRGDFEEAYRQVSAISPAGVFPSHIAHALWVPMDLVEAAVRTNRHAEAAAHVAAMRDDELAAISPRLAFLTAGSAGIAASEYSVATARFEEALALPGVERWPFELARVHLAFGETLRRGRATVQSRVHLDAALEIFARLDARPWATRAANELRATGQTKRRRHHAGSEPLTPQEHEIAMLAAGGLTNKEIAQRLYLSPRTVGAHLYRIFPKLGITSRAALRDALDSDGPQ